MAKKSRRDTLLKRGVQGLVDLYCKPDFVSLCKIADDYRSALGAMGREADDTDVKNDFWAKAEKTISFKALQKDLGAYLDSVFEAAQANDGIRFLPDEYWQLKWTRGTLRSIMIDLDQLISFCLVMQSLQQTVLDKKFDQFRVLEESTREQKLYELSSDAEAVPKQIGVTTNKVFKISAHGAFGVDLLHVHPHEDQLDMVQDIENQTLDNFIQFVRSLLFCFHQKHGGLQRLATCEVCGKLIYKDRLRAEPTCSQVCRSKKSYEEDINRTRCRHRQLGFLANATIRVPDVHPHGIVKDDCKKCQVEEVMKVRSGQCPIVRQRNQKLIEKFDEKKGKWSRKLV